MLKINGGYGESGGQIIRTALALSVITGISFEAYDIRKGRKQGGLKAQHLHCIKALEQLCGAKSEDAVLGSETLKFYPGKLKGGKIKIDIGTAGSISLLLQAVLLPSFFSEKKTRLEITGGTTGKWAMPWEFFENVYLPHLKKFCETVKVKQAKRGYYPAGGGNVLIGINPKYKLSNFSNFQDFLKKIREENLKIIQEEQFNLIQIKGISHASKHLEKSEVADRQAKSARLILGKYNCPINLTKEYSDTLSPGSGITLWAVFSKDADEINFRNPIIIGADALGEIRKSSEEVGREAAEKLIKEISSGAPIDSHTADNLIPWLALFGGKIKVSEITEHAKTNIWVCEQFLGKIFEIDENNKIISAKF